MTIGNIFTDFYDANQARDISRGGGAPLGVVLTEINFIKAQIDIATQASGLSVTIVGSYSVATATLVSGGTGYTNNDLLTLVGGTFSQVGQITVDTVSTGVITTFAVTQIGNYSVQTTNPVAVTGGTGTGATFNIAYNIIGTPMTASTVYFNAWNDPVMYADDASVLARSRMDAVLRYFSALGYRVQRQRVGITDFFQWHISW
jgi:hypothetical protein